MANAKAKAKKARAVVGSPKGSATAADKLMKSMDQLVDSAVQRMTASELRKVRHAINEGIDRVVVAGQRRHRETA
ncbi:MAG: hypothetical protein WAN70_05370 [Terriglobales bacterium]